jgi:N-sulfoglucosamine sulfohydrolase
MVKGRVLKHNCRNALISLWIYVEDICPYIGSYGYPMSNTPNIDKLAANGVLFKNAYATAPVSSAARTANITGVMQTTTGTHSHHNARTVESAVFLPMA